MKSSGQSGQSDNHDEHLYISLYLEAFAHALSRSAASMQRLPRRGKIFWLQTLMFTKLLLMLLDFWVCCRLAAVPPTVAKARGLLLLESSSFLCSAPRSALRSGELRFPNTLRADIIAGVRVQGPPR